MLFLAGLLDLIGGLCLIADLAFGIGEIFSFIPDMIGIVFFGLWVLMRSQMKTTVEGAKEEMGKIAKQKMEHRQKIKKGVKTLKKNVKKASIKGLRVGLASLGELIPILGALPFWTIFVISELKQDS